MGFAFHGQITWSDKHSSTDLRSDEFTSRRSRAFAILDRTSRTASASVSRADPASIFTAKPSIISPSESLQIPAIDPSEASLIQDPSTLYFRSPSPAEPIGQPLEDQGVVALADPPKYSGEKLVRKCNRL